MNIFNNENPQKMFIDQFKQLSQLFTKEIGIFVFYSSEELILQTDPTESFHMILAYVYIV